MLKGKQQAVYSCRFGPGFRLSIDNGYGRHGAAAHAGDAIEIEFTVGSGLAG